MFQDPTVSNVSNCLKYSKMEAVDYDDRLFVRRIQKYRECHIGILSFKRALQSKWAVIGKIKIKIKTIGIFIPSTEKKKEAVEENIDSNSKSIDAEGNEAVKELLEGEFNTELIPNDSEILDKGGGRKKRQFGECLKT